ncbi:MAG: DUF1080 domain-containing protein [Bacteroidota bacterium]
MKYLLLLPLLSLIYVAQPTLRQPDPSAEEWISLFNGEDLTGWHPKVKGFRPGDNYANTFQVEDSLLSVVYDEYESFNRTFAHLISEDKYSYYKLRAVYRFVGEQVEGGPGWAIRNNGLMLHSQPAETMEVDQDFPVSIEVQLLGGNGTEERSTLNLCTPGTHVVKDDELFTRHCTSSSSRTFHGDQWVTAEVLVYGDSMFIHIVGGDTVMRYYHPQIGGRGLPEEYSEREGELLSEGHIAIQGESHPTQFRSIELLNLKGCMDPQAKNYKSYYVEADNDACVY